MDYLFRFCFRVSRSFLFHSISISYVLGVVGSYVLGVVGSMINAILESKTNGKHQGTASTGPTHPPLFGNGTRPPSSVG
jgi:hypothetical protein